MPSFVTPKKNTQFIFYISLVSQTDTKIMQVNPTLAAADFNVATDDGAPGALGTTPVIDADFTRRVKVTLAAGEMNGDNVTFIASDAAGSEWCDLTINLQTTANQIDDANIVIPPTVAQMDARTIVSADYVVVGDTLARVTLVDTVTTNTDINAARGEPAQGAPSVNPSILVKIDWLYKFLRNKITNDGSDIKVYNDAGAVVDHKAGVSEAGGTVERAEFGSGP